VSERRSLSLQAINGNLLPEAETYQSKLRAAMSGCVKPSDVEEIVKGIVERAKKGEPAAVKLLFDYVVGAKNPPTKISIHNHFEDVETGAQAAKALSGRINGRED
jgi:hypothetical protein